MGEGKKHSLCKKVNEEYGEFMGERVVFASRSLDDNVASLFTKEDGGRLILSRTKDEVDSFYFPPGR